MSSVSSYRLWLLALALSIGLSFAVDAWLILAGRIGPELLALVFLAEAALIITGLALLWAWLELRIFRAVRWLTADVGIITHGNPGHESDLPVGHGLGPLPEAVNRLAREYSRARHDTAKAMATASARIERRQARLEAILGDLSEGVLVATLQHRIALYNDTAQRLLEGAGVLGLGRSLTSLLAPQGLREALTRLRASDGEAPSTEVYQFECRPAGGAHAVLKARVRLVLEPGPVCRGYVITLEDPDRHGPARPLSSRAQSPPAQARERAGAVRERPVFYDFDLFEQSELDAGWERPLAKVDYVVFDTETTGLRPSEGDRIVQIAGLRIVSGRLLREECFDCLAHPGRPIPRASTNIHGITDDMVAPAPRLADVVRSFREYCAEAVLVAHNASFDMKFLELMREEAAVAFDQPVLDTLLLSLLLHPEEQSHTLDAITRRFGVEVQARHTALGDTIATAEVFVRMIEMLSARGISTLREALEASNRIYEAHRPDGRF